MLLVVKKCPEFKDYLVPMCEYAGCHEMKPCGVRTGGTDGMWFRENPVIAWLPMPEPPKEETNDKKQPEEAPGE